MKINLRNHLTLSEQRVLFFIIFCFTFGFFLKFVGFGITEETELSAKTIEKISEIKKIIYDLNTVTYDDLITINGIGEKKAKMIIEYQKQFGFKQVEDLGNIKGIGEKTLLKWKDMFYVIINNEKVFLDTNQIIRSEKVSNKQYNLKTVNKEELMSLKGIGEKKAQNIIDFRNQTGFETIEDLKKVKGIGEKIFESISINFYIDNPDKTKELSPQIQELPKKETEIINEKKDINQASIPDLCNVKGIGEKKAKDIVDFRSKLGKITSLDQLLEVKGIGVKTLKSIEEKFYCGE